MKSAGVNTFHTIIFILTGGLHDPSQYMDKSGYYHNLKT
jgi:hypothetical protein